MCFLQLQNENIIPLPGLWQREQAYSWGMESMMAIISILIILAKLLGLSQLHNTYYNY